MSSHVEDYDGPAADECRLKSKRLLEAQNANGFVEVEYRVNESGHLYLIEVNPRLWGWGKFLKLKVPNIIEVLLNDDVEPIINRGHKKWFNILRDLKALHRNDGNGSYLSNVGAFVRSYRGSKILDVFEIRDIRPFIYQIYKAVVK